MSHYQLAFLGFGTVGRALGKLLLRKRPFLKERFGITFSVTGIATGRHGRIVDSRGIDLAKALGVLESGCSLAELATAPLPADSLDFIRRVEADVLFENTPVSYSDGQPAIDHLRAAFERGMHAITANKGPVVHAYRELTDFAADRGCQFRFESTVMDGAPIFSLFRSALPAAELRAFRGILNSTTNLILTRMEAGQTFDEAVSYAQSIGIAETDPRGDVEGWDAAIKVAALVTVLMGIPLKPAEVDRTGIRMLRPADIQRAREEGARWKLVCSARRAGSEVTARVAPEMVSPDSPLFGVSGTSSIVQFETDVLGQLSVVEEDPGPETTAYGLLADFLNVVKR